MSSYTNNYNKNKKVIFQLWTDGRGNFAVKKDEKDLRFEYSNSTLKQESSTSPTKNISNYINLEKS